ncbi:MAG: carbohydrate kinase family protein [Chitinispirillaceae bacterium]
MKPKITVAGHVCLDITPRIPSHGARKIDNVLSPGKLLTLDGVTFTAGGVAGNTGLALLALGAETDIRAICGKDLFGDALSGIFASHGAANCLSKHSGLTTSFTIVLSAAGFDRIFLHESGANDFFTADDINYDRLSPGDIFHFGYPTIMKEMRRGGGEELVRMFSKAKKRGTLTSMDLTLPDSESEAGGCDWKQILENVLPYVDFFTPSYEEILFMLDRDGYGRFRQMPFRSDPLENLDTDSLCALGGGILQLGARTALIKCGIRGMYLKTAEDVGSINYKSVYQWSNRELFCPSFKVDRVVSATGAGDSAIAGFLMSVMKGEPPEFALRTAAAVGARSVKAADSFSAVGCFEDVQKFSQTADLKKCPPLGNHWEKVAESGIWRRTQCDDEGK